MDIRVRDAIAGQQLVFITPDDLVNDALQKLAKHNITSAPVCLTGEGAAGRLTAVGVIDVLDLLSFLVSVSTRVLSTLQSGESRYLTSDDPLMLYRRSKEFRVTSVNEIIGASRRNPLFTIGLNASLREALDFFNREGVHRAVVVDEYNNAVGLLTQSQALKAIIKDNQIISNLRGIPVSRIRMTPIDQIKKVRSNVHAVDAFMWMNECRLSSLAVIDDKNNIIDTISATDLKGIAADFKNLLFPLEHYLQKVRSEVTRPKTGNALITCDANINLLDCINLILGARVHRTYVLDEQRRFMGVVSLTDLLREIGPIISGAFKGEKMQETMQQQQTAQFYRPQAHQQAQTTH